MVADLLMYNIADKSFTILATSVPSERLFSKAVDIVTKKRSRLKPRLLSMLLLLSFVPGEMWCMIPSEMWCIIVELKFCT